MTLGPGLGDYFTDCSLDTELENIQPTNTTIYLSIFLILAHVGVEIIVTKQNKKYDHVESLKLKHEMMIFC